MWSLEVVNPDAVPETWRFAWNADLPQPDYAGFSMLPTRKLVVSHDGALWRMTVDGETVGAGHAALEHALKAGADLHEGAKASLCASMFEASGLSQKEWTFDRMFVSVADSQDWIIPPRHGSGSWTPCVGNIVLPASQTAVEAASDLRAFPHVQSRQLAMLETAYAWPEGLHFDPHDKGWEQLCEDGLATASEGVLRLTEAGIAALDGDPRGLPLAARELIFEAGIPDGLPEDRAATRRSWNDWIGSYRFGGMGRQLREAFENGYELWVDVIDSDPQEICIRGSGVTPSGASLSHGSAIALFAPSWSREADESHLLATAIVDCREALVELLRPTAETAAAPAMA